MDFAENKTFDLRQGVNIKNKNLSPQDVVIIAIDDASYEYILDNYGEWPLRRDIYAKIIDYLEAQSPKIIAFDLMFVKSMKNDSYADKILADSFQKYSNVYTAMNLDNQEEDLRISQNLPQKLAVNVDGDISPFKFSNCRVILQDIINATSNIGMINVVRSDDGVLRSMPLFLDYQGKYYPQLGLKVAAGAIGNSDVKNFIIKNNKLEFGNKKIPVENDGSVILNWYGTAGTFENIPMYKILKAAKTGTDSGYNFKDKVVYIGATASSLFDIKTVPTDRVFPGVEVQATYVQNLLDGNIIKKNPLWVNILTDLALITVTAIIIMATSYMPAAMGILAVIYGIYIFISYELMAHFNLWIEIVSPLSLAILTLVVSVIAKYLIKSKDFDEQYKLATTDGLTELYNHRYFQEQIRHSVEHAKRYNSEFSLVIIDIDYFKKFNDNYGHQSGDAVLKQISSILKRNVRVTDIVCRYGGEEISIILPNTSNQEAINIAQKLCDIVASKQFKLANGKESGVTISLGVSTYGQTDGTTPEEIISSADKRLYNAKNNGRNRVN